MAPEVSIVVPLFNAAATLPRLIAACAAQDFAGDLEIVLVDDGSTDDSSRLAESAGVSVVRQANAGPASARNAGWRAARGAKVLFTDADCVPHADWARRLAAALDAATPVAGGSYGIANPGHLLAEIVHAEIRWRHARLPAEVDFVGSFNLGATRDALEAVGGFDEGFRAASGEDNDLSYRFRDAGMRLRFVPQALVDHHHPTSWMRYLREQARHGEWRVVLYARHPGRATGDSYAGWGDMLSPPLAILTLLWAGLALRFAAFTTPALCSGGFVVAWHAWLALRVAAHTRQLSPFLLVVLGPLRAVARGWGALRGLVRVLMGRGRR